MAEQSANLPPAFNPVGGEKMKHCKVNFNVLVKYTDETLEQVIEVNGIAYTLKYLPRPCSNEKDLFAVFHDGVRFPSLAKFLKSVS
jgi:hypothetical protein